MEWRGQPSRLQNCRLSTGREKGELIVPADVTLDAEAAVQIEQSRAAADENMLAVVDDLPGAGVLIRRRTSAEVRTPFEDLDAVACIGERAGGCNPRDAAAHHDRAATGAAHAPAPANMRFQSTRVSPRSRIAIRVSSGTETRSENTS